MMIISDREYRVFGVSYAGPVFKCKGAFSSSMLFDVLQSGWILVGRVGGGVWRGRASYGLRGKKGEVKTIGELGASVWLPSGMPLFLGVEHG